LTKKAKLRVEKKKKIRRRTPHSRQPAAKSPHTKAQRRRVCVSATVLRNQKKSIRSSIKQKEVKLKHKENSNFTTLCIEYFVTSKAKRRLLYIEKQVFKVLINKIL
jgi:hypothetical protein